MVHVAITRVARAGRQAEFEASLREFSRFAETQAPDSRAYPAVYLFATGVPAVVDGLPALAELLVVNAFAVAALTWVLMPILVEVTASWLN